MFSIITIKKMYSILAVIALSLICNISYAAPGDTVWSNRTTWITEGTTGGYVWNCEGCSGGKEATVKDAKKAARKARRKAKNDEKGVRDTNEPGCNEPGVIC